MDENRREVIVYFANWNLRGKNGHTCEAAELPWDAVTYLNHAFWAVEPEEGPQVTSFQRRDAGQGARTEFRIVSLNPDADLELQEESRLVPGLPRNHFAQYAHLHAQYPDVNIMISIGGWSRCGFFSEMAYTPKGRASFIGSCLELMRTYPWIGGIDIDWEYPAGTRDTERTPGDPDDQGCPIFGTAQEDRENFTALLRELREAMDAAFGTGIKKLTACASGDPGGTMCCQDWAAAVPFLDFINIMTYDLVGPWDGVTGFCSSVRQAEAAAGYLTSLGIPGAKICIGSPLYGSIFLRRDCSGSPIGAATEGGRPPEELGQQRLQQLEQAPGWHHGYDAQTGAAYLYNDDPDSPYYKWFVSYENACTLEGKLHSIDTLGLGGIIVWEASQDTADFAMIRQMKNR